MQVFVYFNALLKDKFACLADDGTFILKRTIMCISTHTNACHKKAVLLKYIMPSVSPYQKVLLTAMYVLTIQIKFIIILILQY